MLVCGRGASEARPSELIGKPCAIDGTTKASLDGTVLALLGFRWAGVLRAGFFVLIGAVAGREAGG